ncbi:Adenosine receptor A1 [Acipenser ruthenus]|uniref:Adenosine receptor A1 n=1 Tax=Acipenser ruthenus TaxID=7906 RepID=A0A662YLM1_ACIRT|nr:Adenosine receptor A1 [Acipenser ruthenus]
MEHGCKKFSSMAEEMNIRGHVDVLYISIETGIALASVLGNILVVLVVRINRALRDTTFCFMVSLALADIAVGVLVIPLAIIVSLGLKTQFYTCLFFACLLVIITQSSILSLLAIAIDRYLRVKIPTRRCPVIPIWYYELTSCADFPVSSIQNGPEVHHRKSLTILCG